MILTNDDNGEHGVSFANMEWARIPWATQYRVSCCVSIPDAHKLWGITMKLSNLSFAVSTSFSKGGKEHVTNVTLTECDVSENIVMAALTSGSSPRVNKQGAWRRAKNGIIPANVTMTWKEWIGEVRMPNAPATPESVAGNATADPKYMRGLIEGFRAKGYDVSSDMLKLAGMLNEDGTERDPDDEM